ncbi:MAG: sulfotransferase family protein [Gammaproteobacteria bacterium]|nr:sulfotransferase family protein [Gammaproteobacteria bacterium]|tara:strand:- start:183 stop:1295 length:1113 start_codon:yes stop_codon:yes gene_type:complete
MQNFISEKSILKSVKGSLGGEDYKEPLTVLIESLNHEANLNAIGRIALKYQISSHLKIRAKIFSYLEDNAFTKPSNPIFVIGLPRSGTTFLFNLLSLDPNYRSPLMWEMFFPFPLLQKKSISYKLRLKKADLLISFQKKLIPDLDVVHPINSTDPEECLLITPYSLKSLLYSYMANIPSYEDYLQQADKSSVYLWHSRFLGVLESMEKPTNWLLKDPNHIAHLSEIKSIYPEARFINIHRDPIESIPSICSLTEKTRRPFSQDVDKIVIGERTLAYWERALKKGKEAKDDIDKKDYLNLRFRDLVDNPLKQMELIYTHFGLNFSDKLRMDMTCYIDKFKSIKLTKHNYRLEEFGLNEDSVQNTVGKYLDF